MPERRITSAEVVELRRYGKRVKMNRYKASVVRGLANIETNGVK